MNSNRTNKKTKGITLIETVLYLSLFSLLMTLIMPFFIEHDAWQTKQAYLSDALRDRLFLDDTLKHLLRGPVRVISPPQNETSSELIFENDNGRLTFEPASFFPTSTVLTNVNFYRKPNNGFETMEFGLTISGFDFGTTTYLIFEE